MGIRYVKYQMYLTRHMPADYLWFCSVNLPYYKIKNTIINTAHNNWRGRGNLFWNERQTGISQAPTGIANLC